MWPLSPAAGRGSTGLGFTSGFGYGGNGSCPQLKPGSDKRLQPTLGGDGVPGMIVTHRCLSGFRSCYVFLCIELAKQHVLEVAFQVAGGRVPTP